MANTSNNILADIKITMLGGSGAGKTCFMLAMYDIMSMGVEGFTFSTINPDDGLDLEDQWNKLCDGTDVDRWPKGSEGSRPYTFRFSFGFKEYLSFEWLDYRGGALTGRADDPDLAKLRSSLKSSFGIFIVVPADQLVKNDRQAIRGMNVKGINQLLAELSDESHPRVVSIVITKMDIWLKEIGLNQQNELVSRIKSIFSPLFVPDGNWTVSIVPITLGENLCDNLARGAIAPQLIHYPVTFTIYELFLKQLEAAEAEKQILIDRSANRKPPTFWGDLFGRPDSNDAESEAKKAQLEAWSISCKAACQNISQALKADIPIFKNGKSN